MLPSHALEAATAIRTHGLRGAMVPSESSTRLTADGRVSWPGGDGFDLEQYFGSRQAGDPDHGVRGRVGTPAAPHGLRDGARGITERNVRIEAVLLERTMTLLNCHDLDIDDKRQFRMHRIQRAVVLPDTL